MGEQTISFQQVANELEQSLIEQLSCYRNLEFQVQLNPGVRPYVEVERENRRCTIEPGSELKTREKQTFGSAVRLWRPTTLDASIMSPSLRYQLGFFENGEVRLSSSTTDLSELVQGLQGWLINRDSITAVEDQFVGQNQRAAQRFADWMHSKLHATGRKTHVSIEGVPTTEFLSELWVCLDERSCSFCVVGQSNSIGCVLWNRGVPLARIQTSVDTDAFELVLDWIFERKVIHELQSRFRSLELANAAIEFEKGDFAEWHWSFVRLRARWLRQKESPTILPRFLPVVETMAKTPSVRRFFSYVQLNRFCFSRCSYFPYLTHRLPQIGLTDEGFSVFGSGPDRMKLLYSGDAVQVCRYLEELLGKVEAPTFFGSARDELASLVNRVLEQRKNVIRYTSTQTTGTFCRRAIIGKRSCDLAYDEYDPFPFQFVARLWGDAEHVGSQVRVKFLSVDSLADATQKWLERGCSLVELERMADGFRQKSLI